MERGGNCDFEAIDGLFWLLKKEENGEFESIGVVFLMGLMMFGRDLDGNSRFRNSYEEILDLDKMVEISIGGRERQRGGVFKWFMHPAVLFV